MKKIKRAVIQEEKKVYLIKLKDSLVVLSKTPKLSRMDIVSLKLNQN